MSQNPATVAVKMTSFDERTRSGRRSQRSTEAGPQLDSEGSLSRGAGRTALSGSGGIFPTVTNTCTDPRPDHRVLRPAWTSRFPGRVCRD